MNDKVVLDFGKIISEMKDKNVKLLLVKDKSWFVIDDNNNLFAIENYWHNSYLDKLIAKSCVVAFFKSNVDLSGFNKEIWDIDKVQQFIENVVNIEYPNNAKETASEGMLVNPKSLHPSFDSVVQSVSSQVRGSSYFIDKLPVKDSVLER